MLEASDSVATARVSSVARVRTAAPKSGGAKKLVIKPLKSSPKLPANFEDQTWTKLQAAVRAVHSGQPVATSLEELYRAVEDMCTHKLAHQLYTNLQTECDAFIGKDVSALHPHVSLDGLQFLKRVNATWTRFCEQMLLIRSIFLCLDRTYVYPKVELGVRSLFDMGLQLFCKHVQNTPDIRDKTVDCLLALVKQERTGDTVDRGLLKSLIRMFSNLGVYTVVFQAPFLSESEAFYAAEGRDKVQTLDVPAYLLHCETRLQQENDRCNSYLDASTKRPLIETVETQLAAQHMEGLLDRGFSQLLLAVRLEDLGRVFMLCSRIHFLDKLRICFKECIKEYGKQIVLDESREAEMVDQLLKFKQQTDSVVKEAFRGEATFNDAQKEAFEHFINQRENKPAELIAKFIDSKLKAGNKAQSDEELEADLNKALVLFRFIQGKDVFEAFYKKDLAKRLLLNRSASIDSEKSMISKLKAECGAQFTNKLEGMFKDVDLSRELMASFREAPSVQQKIPPGIEIYVNILTSGFWPTYPVIEVNLPEELNAYQSVFAEFYLSKHSGRRLLWQNSLGQCVLKTKFAKGAKELVVSLFQAVVLLQFNDVGSSVLTLRDLAEATRIEDKELRRTLQSLACGKIRVLNKEPKGREVNDGDAFTFNEALSEPRYRIKINTIQMKETQEENKKTNDQVMQDRQYQIDAAIVRVMKMRKTLSHRLLIQELVQQLRFSVKASDLKKRIESLIDREYLERDPSEKDVYRYLA